MKRIGYLYDSICDTNLIKIGIRNAAKGKTKRHYIAKVLKRIDYFAKKLKYMLESDTVELSENHTKEIYDNSCLKKRIITVPKFFPDQVIHWLIIMKLEKVMMKSMYKYTCGSVPNRGGKEAKKLVVKALNNHKMRYVAKLDISKFFNTVKPEILSQMIKRKVKDKRFTNLVDMVLKNGGDCLPIGYYTSQWLSNFYLEGLDHFVKEQLRIKYFVRYVDDMVLIDSNKRKLHKAVIAINQYLNEIGLKLKRNWQVWKIDSRPIDFVGFQFFRNKIKLRRRIYFRLCRRVRNVRKKNNNISLKQAMGILSLVGWLAQISNGYNFYKLKIYPYAPKKKMKKIVSNYSKKRNGGKLYVRNKKSV